MSVIAYGSIANDNKITFSYSKVKKRYDCLESLLNVNVVREDKQVYVETPEVVHTNQGFRDNTGNSIEIGDFESKLKLFFSGEEWEEYGLLGKNVCDLPFVRRFVLNRDVTNVCSSLSSECHKFKKSVHLIPLKYKMKLFIQPFFQIVENDNKAYIRATYYFRQIRIICENKICIDLSKPIPLLKEVESVNVIKRKFRESITDPEYNLCKRRLLREFDEHVGK